MDLLTKVKRYGDRLAQFPSELVNEKEALRCLEQLKKVPMTRAILEESMIGKSLNDFRKIDAVSTASPAVCKQCKELIRHWKAVTLQSMPHAKANASSNLSSPLASTTSPSTHKNETGSSKPVPRDLAGRPTRSQGQASSSHAVNTLQSAASPDVAGIHFKKPGQRTARGPSDPSPVGETPATHLKKSSASAVSAQSSTIGAKKRPSGPGAVPPAKKARHDDMQAARQQTEPAAVSLSPPEKAYRRPPPPPPTQDSAPRRNQLSGSAAPDMDVGQRSHDQHTMYSGRRKGAVGNVPSLMTLAMRVLIDNIDCIEETGMPFHVLEPLLEKASARQLARLESFNMQVCDDTADLWKRHCMKDLRTARPNDGESWKDCYFRTLDEKDRRLESLAARINEKKTHEAKEAAKHAAKLTDVKRMPGRRSGGSGVPAAVSGWQRSSAQRPAAASTAPLLMQKTMKMAQASRRHPSPIASRSLKLGRR